MQSKIHSGSTAKEKVSHYSKSMFVDSLSKFVPSLVIQKLITSQDETEKAQLPELQAMETVVMFADISGFTNLSESCAKNGLQGNEDLAFCINRYMEGMVRYLNQYGGDIIKFVGDAMIVMWPPIDTSATNFDTLKMDTIRRAIQCSQDIQKTMHNFQLLPGINLSVKIGIGYGQCGILYVGGVFNRAETLTVGDALVDALKSEGMATSGGQVIVAESCYTQVSDFFKATRLRNEETKETFYLVNLKHMANRVKIQADAIKLRAQFSSEILLSIKRKLMGCVPHCVIPFLKIEQENFASEVRSLTVMFLSLGVNLSSAASQSGMDKIQSIVTEVQKQVYRLQGSINKLVMDDKGSTMICIWGLLPLAHHDDASRALLTGFNIIKALKKIPDTYCNIGVSSGECFSGITGTSGSRKEFSVLGDIVNLAARIMGSMKGNEKNKIKCDLNTRMLAANDFDFVYQRHAELKGKSISIPFFAPQDPFEKFKLASTKVLRPEYFLQEHQNPMYLERNTDYDRFTRTIGFETILKTLTDDVIHYTGPQEGCRKPYLALLKGQIGSGKTALMKHLFRDLKSVNLFQPYLERNKRKLPIFSSQTNPETMLQFLNIWRPIFQMLLWFHCKKNGLRREVVIAETIIKSGNKDKTDLICELVGVQKQHLGAKYLSELNVIQVKPKEDPLVFVKLPDYEEYVKDQLIEYLVKLFQLLIGEGKEFLSDWGSDNSDDDLHGKLGVKNSSASDSNDGISEPPIFICLDDSHNMCPTSWRLLSEILQQCEHLMLYLIVKSDEKDRLLIKIESAQAFEQAWQTIQEDIDVHVIDLPLLTVGQISDIIVASAEYYKNSFTNEVKDMTTIFDPSNTIKDAELSEHWRTTLIEQYQLKTQILSIDEQVVEIISQNCQRNVLFCLQYFVNMLQSDFLKVMENGNVCATKKFMKCKLIDEWTTVSVPRLALKLNMQAMSEFFFSIQAKRQNKKPGELKGATTALVILKVCSVLGHEFGLEALKFISPLKKNPLNTKRIDQAIRLLEQNDFLEIVDCTDPYNNQCRFRKTFLRETLYQMLRYKSSKKDLHAAIERFMQKQQPTEALTRYEAHVKAEKLLRHMLLAQDCSEEAQLMFERRTALTVMRIQNLIQRRPGCIVLSGQIFKPSNQGSFNSVKKRFRKTGMVKKLVQLSTSHLKWFSSEEDMRNDNYRGCVKLPFIYEVIRMSAIDKDTSFRLGVSLYEKQNKVQSGKRDLIFSCNNAFERDKWIAAIDYLKTRAIYETYSKSNRLVSFMSTDAVKQKGKPGEDDVEMDKADLLYDFGEQLKSQTHMSHINVFTPKGSQGGMARQNSIQFRKSSFMNQRQSQNNINLIKNLQSNTNIKAQDIVNKLGLLYKVGMTSLVHHLHHMNLKNLNAVGVSHAQKKEVEETMQYPTKMSHMKELIQQELFDDEQKQIMLQRANSASTEKSRQSFIGTMGAQFDDLQRKLTNQKTMQSYKSFSLPQTGKSTETAPETTTYFRQPVMLQKNLSEDLADEGVKFTKQLNNDKKLKGERRQSSLSAGLKQQQSNLAFDPNKLIEEVNESSMSSQELESSEKSSSKADNTDMIKRPSQVESETALMLPDHFVKTSGQQQIQLPIDQISSQHEKSSFSRTQDSSAVNMLPSQHRKKRSTRGRISFQRSARKQDQIESALVEMFKLQQEKIDQMLRQQQEFQLQMTQHQNLLTSQTFQQALRRHSFQIQGDSGQTMILPHHSNYNATSSVSRQIPGSRRGSSILQHHSQLESPTQKENNGRRTSSQNNETADIFNLEAPNRSARRFTFNKNDASADSKELKRPAQLQMRLSAPGKMHMSLIDDYGQQVSESHPDNGASTPELNMQHRQINEDKHQEAIRAKPHPSLKKQQSEQLRQSNAATQKQLIDHEESKVEDSLRQIAVVHRISGDGGGPGPQMTEERQLSSAPKQPMSVLSNLSSMENSEDDEEEQEDPAQIFAFLRQDSKAESGNIDVINRHPVNKPDETGQPRNQQVQHQGVISLDQVLLSNANAANFHSDQEEKEEGGDEEQNNEEGTAGGINKTAQIVIKSQHCHDKNNSEQPLGRKKTGPYQSPLRQRNDSKHKRLISPIINNQQQLLLSDSLSKDPLLESLNHNDSQHKGSGHGNSSVRLSLSDMLSKKR